MSFRVLGIDRCRALQKLGSTTTGWLGFAAKRASPVSAAPLKRICDPARAVAIAPAVSKVETKRRFPGSNPTHPFVATVQFFIRLW